MNEQVELAELKKERKELLVWFASRPHKPEIARAWTLNRHRLEEIHRRIDEITGEPKFHR